MTPPDPARRAAAALVAAVTDEGRSLDAALDTTRSYQPLAGRDRAFARAIASATLRRLGRIDAVLADFMARPLGEGAEAARAILRTGAAQLLALEVAPHAAVSASVDLANAARSAQPFAKLINAVLRKVAGPGRERFAALGPAADLPDWLWTRWRAAYGAQAEAIVAALGAEPPLDLSVRDDPAAWAERLGGRVIETGAVRLAGAEAVPDLFGFDEGAWWVQDAAARLPAMLLGDVAGLRVLDLCAAPGGKTLQLAAAGAVVTALDIEAGRLDLLKANLNRTGLSAEIVCADALDWTPPELFDAVLLDAPCTATGTLRRHPDVAWLRRPTDVAKLAEAQGRLLARAAQFVRPGGRLVYAVCSLEPEEGPAIAAASGLLRDPLRPGEAPAWAITPDGDLRTLPCHLADLGGLDGFYAARFLKT